VSYALRKNACGRGKKDIDPSSPAGSNCGVVDLIIMVISQKVRAAMEKSLSIPLFKEETY